MFELVVFYSLFADIDAEPISSPSPTPPSKSPVPSKHVSSSSLESSDQSDTLSVKSLQLPRAGTMSESMLRSKSSEICFSRPKSEVPVGGMGYGDLEASFEVRFPAFVCLECV